MAQGMGYDRLWIWRGMVKIGSKNDGKIVKNVRKILGSQNDGKLCYGHGSKLSCMIYL